MKKKFHLNKLLWKNLLLLNKKISTMLSHYKNYIKNEQYVPYYNAPIFQTKLHRDREYNLT